MDSQNFQHYRNGWGCKFYGGEALRSLLVLTVPNEGHWYVVFDLGGASGTIRSSVTVISEAA